MVERHRRRFVQGSGRSAASDDPDGVLLGQSTADGEDFVGGNGARKEADIFPLIEVGLFPPAAEYKNRHRGQAGSQFLDKCRATDSGPIESHDDEPEFLSKQRLFDKDERCRGVGCALDMVEMALED